MSLRVKPKNNCSLSCPCHSCLQNCPLQEYSTPREELQVVFLTLIPVSVPDNLTPFIKLWSYKYHIYSFFHLCYK